MDAVVERIEMWTVIAPSQTKIKLLPRRTQKIIYCMVWNRRVGARTEPLRPFARVNPVSDSVNTLRRKTAR